ncbi:MAG TPA: DNA gyrase inhibitor YacG [Kofleriaceae bacterium]
MSKDPARPSKLFPFCSERCHLVDLGRWLGEDYRIPGPPAGLVAPASDDD